MNLNSENQNKFGSGYFSLNVLSYKKRDQLLKPTNGNYSNQNLQNPHYIIQNVKRDTQYIESLKNEIHFTSDVVAERCIHLLPYNDRFYDTLYDVQKRSKKKPHSMTKLVHKIPIMHHCSHVVKECTMSTLPPVRKWPLSRSVDGSTTESVGEIMGLAEGNDDVKKNKKYWDEYLISLMSPGTAQYLAFEASQNESQAKRLQDLVQKWYGPASTYRELIPDDTVEATEESSKNDLRSTFPYKYYMDLVQNQRTSQSLKPLDNPNVDTTPKQKITDLLSRENTFNGQDKQTDPYGDETKASFYRLPGILRRNKKNSEILVKDSGNKTVDNAVDYVLPNTPPRRLDTVLNPKIGDKILISDNQFHQDLLISTDVNQTKMLKEPDDIIMIDDKIYKKTLQPVWPTVITGNVPSEDCLDSFKPLKNNLVKGHNRWTKLPEREESNLRSTEDNSIYEEQSRLESRKRVRDHSSVNLIVDQWRKKWQLTQKYNDSTVEALLKDMVDPHPTIRMQAIVTIAKSGSHATSLVDGISSGQRKETIGSDAIPKVLLDSIEILLDDTHHQVKKAAAVALHSLEKQTEKSLHILRTMLSSGSNVDRWTAAQCLALSDACDSHVIAELVDQLMNSEDFLIHEKASLLLAKISYHSKLVHGLLGEKLNTVSWRQRIIICKTLPLLHGSLNKDILRKLIYLMWQDPHKEVRIASSQVVGKTGNGKSVHDELIKKLQHQSEIVRADALEKIGILKVMTTRMMPGFLKCFTDDFVIVRKEVCRTCYSLSIQDDLCIRKMLTMARYDPSYKVKIYALRALGKIRTDNPEIHSCFVWALLYEAETQVRYEALHSLLIHRTIDKDTVDLLMSRFLVENDKHIVKLLRKTLNSVGINPDEDIDTVAEVKSEVRRFLADRNHITDVILVNEAEEDYALQRDLMLASSAEESSISSRDPVEDLNRDDSSKYIKDVHSSMSQSEEEDNVSNIEQSLEIRFDDVRRQDIVAEVIDYVSKVNEEGKDVELIIVQSDPENVTEAKEQFSDTVDAEHEINMHNLIDKEEEEEERVKNIESIVNESGENMVEETSEIKDDKDRNETEDNKYSLLPDGNEIELIDKDDSNEEKRDTVVQEELAVTEFVKNSSGVETFIKTRDDTKSVDLCTYRLPSDTSYLKTFSSERSLTWLTLETPVIATDPTQLDMLESTINSSIMELVNEAIEYEGIDCGSED